jgi:hypothetical protein
MIGMNEILGAMHDSIDLLDIPIIHGKKTCTIDQRKKPINKPFDHTNMIKKTNNKRLSDI